MQGITSKSIHFVNLKRQNVIKWEENLEKQRETVTIDSFYQ